MLFSLAMLAFEITFSFYKSCIVKVSLFKMFCTNTVRTLQRKENYSMIFVNVEESYLYFSIRFRKAPLYLKGKVCLCLKNFESKDEACSALCFPRFSDKDEFPFVFSLAYRIYCCLQCLK